MGIKRELNREGFSLIEMIIAVAVAAIVMSAVLLLITYSSNSMNRTGTAVNVQNQAKDATMHITTYLQEGSDAHADTGNNAVIIVNEKKNDKGEVVSADVSYYWFVSGDKTIYFFKDDYKNVNTIGTSEIVPIKDSNDRIDFSKIKSDANTYKHFLKFKDLQTSTSDGYNYKEIRTFVKNCIGFACTENPGTIDVAVTPDPAATALPIGATPGPSPAPEKKAIGGKSFTIKMALKSENGDSEFTCDKTVYLRNQ